MNKYPLKKCAKWKPNNYFSFVRVKPKPKKHSVEYFFDYNDYKCHFDDKFIQGQ